MKGTASQPPPTAHARIASTARSTAGAKASAMEARRGRDAMGGSMRSTTARSGIAGDTQSRRTSEAHLLKPVEPQTRLHASPQNHRTAHPRNRHCDEPRKRNHAFVHIRTSVHPRFRKWRRQIRARAPHDKARERSEGRRDEQRKKAPRRQAGCWAMFSRPCCATRSGCARRPRLRPGGRRWSPGTTGHPASPTDRVGPPC